jgi:transcriptional regulator with XRE-family HTH domain
MDEPKPMTELTRIREECALSQQGLADASGVNKATINQIERGRRSPNARTLEKLAAALGVEIGDFFPLAQAPLPVVKGSAATAHIQTTATAEPRILYILRRVAQGQITPEEGTQQLLEEIIAA